MSQSIDFRINDFINEYLDYKGYSKTVNTFSQERESRQEPINKVIHGNLYEKDKEKYKLIKVVHHQAIIFFPFFFSTQFSFSIIRNNFWNI